MIHARSAMPLPSAAPRRLRGSPSLPGLALAALALTSAPLQAQQQDATADCSGVPDHQRLTQALRGVVAPGDPEVNGGLGNHMWAVVVNRAGSICTVARSGEAFGDQWLGSRPIAAEKAFTANAFSLPGFALSTANLYWPTQPENSLYALATSNPVHEEAFYVGEAETWGTEDDPVLGQRLGGTVVFGGGFALYEGQGELVGALGISGDESCTDHVVAWKVRHALNLDNVPAGVTKANDDGIIHDLSVDPATGRMQSASGYGTGAPCRRRRRNCPATRPRAPRWCRRDRRHRSCRAGCRTERGAAPALIGFAPGPEPARAQHGAIAQLDARPETCHPMALPSPVQRPPASARI